MNGGDAHTIQLYEYRPLYLPADRLTREQELFLWENYRNQIEIEAPSVRTNGRWKLTSQGWVGAIPVDDSLTIVMRPKVPIANIFRMLELAYDLESFRFLDGATDCDTIEDVYDRLAIALADRVLARGRRGYHREYLSASDDMRVVRGKLDVDRMTKRPWSVDLHCHYQEHTADIDDNRILAYTLNRIARSQGRSQRALHSVRAAFRSIGGAAGVQAYGARDCVGRIYHRLNQDYESMHMICRFFLEHSGPLHDSGERQSLPFLVNMAHLYEVFVARWLRLHLPDRYRLEAQEGGSIGREGRLEYEIDLVIYDLERGEPAWVLDTKYKHPDHPSNADVYQILSYALVKDCRRGALVYPASLASPFAATVRHIDVQSMTFELEGDLDEAGWKFMARLGLATAGQ